MQVAEEAFDVRAVPHQQEDVLATARGGADRRSGAQVEQARAGAGTADPGGTGEARHGRDHGGPETALRGERFGDRVRHALAVEVEQGEGRLAGREVDVVARARDGASLGLASRERTPGGDGHHIGQVGAEAPEGDRLVGRHGAECRRQIGGPGQGQTLGPAFGHDAGGAVARHAPVGVEADALGERAARFRQESEFRADTKGGQAGGGRAGVVRAARFAARPGAPEVVVLHVSIRNSAVRGRRGRATGRLRSSVSALHTGAPAAASAVGVFVQPRPFTRARRLSPQISERPPTRSSFSLPCFTSS